MATIKDVARRAEVSVATVSRVMNHTAQVNEETRDRIIDVIRELNYVPSSAARSMRTQQNPVAEVILIGEEHMLAPICLKAVREEAARQGWTFRSIVLPLGGNDTDSLIGFCSAAAERKVILMRETDTELSAYLRQRTERAGILLVGNAPVEGYPCVMAEEQAGMRMLVRRLVRDGAKRMEYVGSAPDYREGILFSAFAEELERAGQEAGCGLLCSGAYDMKGGAEAAKYLLWQGGQLPHAVVFESEAAAFGFAQYCAGKAAPRARKIRIAAIGGGTYAQYSALPTLLCRVRKKQFKRALWDALRMQQGPGKEFVIPVPMKLKEYPAFQN